MRRHGTTNSAGSPEPMATAGTAAWKPPKLRQLRWEPEQSPMHPPSDPVSGSNFDPRLVRALDHPVRTRFLKLLTKGKAISPSEALPLLDCGELALSSLVYHSRVLEHLEMIEPTEEPNHSGGASFRATAKGEEALMVLGFCGG